MPRAAKTPEVSVSDLKELLRLDPETGRLFWRERSAKWFKREFRHLNAEQQARVWNTKWAGKEAMALIKPNGYRYGPILARKMYAHRVVFALHKGYLPRSLVDHKDGDVTNNRPDNLREVTPGMNQRNQRQGKKNTSGVTGASWSAALGKWRAAFRYMEKTCHVGYFETIEEAAKAVLEARISHGYSPSHGEVRAQSSKANP